jgi:hypothetical protein
MYRRLLVVLSLLVHLACSSRRCHASVLSPTEIERLTGVSGKMDETEGVFKVSLPRSDLAVMVGGIHVTPPMGLTCWAAFTAVEDQVMVMGDMVLLENQVNPVMSIALDNGLEVTALHNHFSQDSPRIMFMHISGMGQQAQLAEAVGKVLQAIRQPGTPSPNVTIDPATSSLDAARIEKILGRKGVSTDGVYKLTFGRATTMHGRVLGNAMGVNTWAAFAGSDDKAVVDGDFAMEEGEVQGVLKALRAAGINIVAIHNHMAGESPRILFLHYWGVGKTEDLAHGLKGALDVLGTSPAVKQH